MKTLLIKTTVILFCLTTPFACSDDDMVSGEGPAVTRTLALSPVQGLVVSGAMSVVVAQGETQEVIAEGPANLIDILSTRVNNGVWDVRFTENVRELRDFTILITVTDLTLLDLSGASTVTTGGDLTLDELAIASSGASNITLRGTVNRQTLDLSGASDVNNFSFESHQTVVEASGAAEVEVNVTERLDVTVSGSSTVTYRGNPATVNTEVSGAGKVVEG